MRTLDVIPIAKWPNGPPAGSLRLKPAGDLKRHSKGAFDRLPSEQSDPDPSHRGWQLTPEFAGKAAANGGAGLEHPSSADYRNRTGAPFCSGAGPAGTGLSAEVAGWSGATAESPQKREGEGGKVPRRFFGKGTGNREPGQATFSRGVGLKFDTRRC